jgi:hypothetical protein
MYWDVFGEVFWFMCRLGIHPNTADNTSQYIVEYINTLKVARKSALVKVADSGIAALRIVSGLVWVLSGYIALPHKAVCFLDSGPRHRLVELLHAVPIALLAPVKTADIHSIQSKSTLKKVCAHKSSNS